MKTKLLIVLCLLFSFSSCNQWLDVELDNKVDLDKLFRTPEGFKEALAGIYSEISKQDMYGQALTMENIDVLAQYYSYSKISSNYQYWKDYDYVNDGTKSKIASFWNRLYSNISQANCILEWADINAHILNESERNQIKGEALALRAYLHFDLYRLFSPDAKLFPNDQGIPYNKTFGVSLPPMYSAIEVLQLVINDLTEAEQYLANDPIREVVPYALLSQTDRGDVVDKNAKNMSDKYVARMNLYAVKAMLARVHQARGEYTKAIQYAQYIIESEKFRLLDFGSIDQNSTSIDLLFSDEHIFSLRNNQLNRYSRVLHQDNSQSGATVLTPLPVDDLASLYESNNDDVRYSKWFSIGKLVKFMSDTSSVYPQKMPMIKLSEMYLLVAECSYNSDPETALEYINQLRDHRIRNNAHWTYLTPGYIREEMRREYFGEGQMWYAYKRNALNLPGNENVNEVIGTKQIYTFPLPDKEIENGYR